MLATHGHKTLTIGCGKIVHPRQLTHALLGDAVYSASCILRRPIATLGMLRMKRKNCCKTPDVDAECGEHRTEECHVDMTDFIKEIKGDPVKHVDLIVEATKNRKEVVYKAIESATGVSMKRYLEELKHVPQEDQDPQLMMEKKHFIKEQVEDCGRSKEKAEEYWTNKKIHERTIELKFEIINYGCLLDQCVDPAELCFEPAIDDYIRSISPEKIVIPEEVDRLYYCDERFEAVYMHKYSLSKLEYLSVIGSNGSKKYEDFESRKTEYKRKKQTVSNLY